MSQAIRRAATPGTSRTDDRKPIIAHHPDLSPYDDLGDTPAQALRVGWISADHPFPTGDAPPGLVLALLSLVRDHPVNRVRSWEPCTICTDPPYPIVMEIEGTTLHLGDAEIRVTGEDGTVYAAPSLIAHYVAEHRYLPPAPFIDAALR
jgi:hypothetical protein